MWLEMIWMDVRHSFRMMRKSPGFSAVAVLSLGLGIGATTAIFCVMDALMLRPLPQIRDQQDVLSGVFAYRQTTFALATRGEMRSIPGIYVSGTTSIHLASRRFWEEPCYRVTINLARHWFASSVTLHLVQGNTDIGEDNRLGSRTEPNLRICTSNRTEARDWASWCW
jgi:hypothetical protein